MKYNLQTLNNTSTIYFTLCFNILLNVLNYKVFYLLFNFYKITLVAYRTMGLRNRLLDNIWYRPIVRGKKLILNHQLSSKLILTTRYLPAIHITHTYIVSSNFTSPSCINILKIFNINLHFQLLIFFSNYYYRSISNFNNYSLILTYYLINNCNIQALTSRPLNIYKSLFIINVKKL